MALILMVYVITIYSVVLGRSPVVVGEIELSFVIRLAARGWGIYVRYNAEMRLRDCTRDCA